jgi:hypothetical protein
LATGTLFLAAACGVAIGPVDSPTGVIRNIAAAAAAAVPASVPAPVATFEGTGTTTLDLGAGLLADGEPYLLDVVFTAAGELDALTVDELDDELEPQRGGLAWDAGSFEGRFLLNTGDSTTRYLQVETEGSWTFTIWPLRSTVERWPGGEAHGIGPNVLLFNGEPGVVSFAHRGESNFLANFYGDDGLLEASISEAEDVDGTITLPVSPAVVAVETAGEWWLRR